MKTEEKLKLLTDSLVDYIGIRDEGKLTGYKNSLLQLAEIADDSGEPDEDLERAAKLIDSLIIALYN